MPYSLGSTGARRNPATCGTYHGNDRRRCGPTLQGINKLIFYTPGQRQEDAAAGLHALCVSDEVRPACEDFPVTCSPLSVTLPDIGVPQYIGVPHRVTYPYGVSDEVQRSGLRLPSARRMRPRGCTPSACPTRSECLGCRVSCLCSSGVDGVGFHVRGAGPWLEVSWFMVEGRGLKVPGGAG